MNYTPKHHLPQWVKSDRIMMDDFNQMCLDIEAGLNKAQANTSSAAAQVQSNLTNGLNAAQSERTRLQNILEGMSRDNYRHIAQLRAHHGFAGPFDSLWVNSLNSTEEAGGFADGEYGIYLGGTPATADAVINSANQSDYISVGVISSYHSRKASVTFTSDGYGILEKVQLFNEYEPNPTAVHFSFMITLTREDTGMIVAQAGPFTSKELPDRTNFYYETVNFALAPGIPYRMEYSVPESVQDYKRITSFMLASKRHTQLDPPIVIAPLPARAALSHTVAVPSWARGGTAIVRWAGTGSITLTVNGTRLTASQTKDAINAVNAPCKQSEYPLSQVPTGTAVIALSAQKGTGDFQVYDYSVIWK